MLSAYSNIVEDLIGFKRHIAKKLAGVYLITNTLNCKTYVGSSNSLYSRIYSHYKLIIDENHCNRHLNFASKKNSINNFEFEILQYFKQDDFLDKKFLQKLIIKAEQFYIDALQAVKFGYNLSIKAEYPRIGEPWNKGLKTGANPLCGLKKGNIAWNKGIKLTNNQILGNKFQLKPIIQFDLEGNKINEFISMNQAHRITKINLSIIRDKVNNNFKPRKICKNSNLDIYKYKFEYKN